MQSRLGKLPSSNIAGNNHWLLRDFLATRAFINCTQTKGYIGEAVVQCISIMYNCAVVNCSMKQAVLAPKGVQLQNIQYVDQFLICCVYCTI